MSSSTMGTHENLSDSRLNLVNVVVPEVKEDHSFFSETHFRHMLRVERMRTERSKTPFMLLLIDASRLVEKYRYGDDIDLVKSALSACLRETDVRGWYHTGRTFGIIFTEIPVDTENFLDVIIQKIYTRFCNHLDPDIIKNISISFHLFPEINGSKIIDETFNINLYPDLTQKTIGRRLSLAVKKFIDIAGSLTGLLIFSPVFLAMAIAIKATSPGPVFFRQDRVGYNGKVFSFLKFRSMKVDNDSSEHKAYIAKFINDQKNAAVEPGVFKLTNDSRITPIGSFIRKTSLDELPQLINVLKGDMSLVGPRPPIPYECELYDIWHRRRLLSCRPGITGLWQVVGRSRTTFDEMVRLDLKYIREWSLWLDIKILLKTPKAVLGGSGAM